ncbi:MAG: hypothetical protein WBC91_20835 [Phototrophicaceae bacterium]
MRKHPLQFRKEEIYDVMTRFRASESASLVGVGSVGKSNLLHHIMDRETITHYLGERSQSFYPIMIDPNLLGTTNGESEQFKCWAGYELLMHRMFLALHPFEMLDSDAQSFAKTYRELQDGTNPLYSYMGLRYFELGLEYFFRRDLQVVFLFDEFEELLRTMPVKFFQSLRGLRDTHKTQLSFLTFSREPIPILIEKMGLPQLEIEPFTELFTDNVYYVGPYNHDDALAMIQSLAKRNTSAHISQDAINFLLFATGRFAGIMRAGFRELEILGEISPADLNNNNLIERLARRTRVRAECETIWKSLTDTEQQVLASVIRQSPEEIDDEAERAISLLVQKHLLRVNRNTQTLQIEPPVFHFYVHSVVFRL